MWLVVNGFSWAGLVVESVCWLGQLLSRWFRRLEHVMLIGSKALRVVEIQGTKQWNECGDKVELWCWTASVLTVEVKVKVGFFYSATYAAMHRPAALYNRTKWQLIGKSQWCGSAMLQLQHTPPPQSTTPGLHPVSIHQMAQPVRGSKHPITAYYSVYRPRKDERLSRPIVYQTNLFPFDFFLHLFLKRPLKYVA